MEKSVVDGGEAILAALRNLGVDYVFSSPGSEWGAAWEAFARQKVSGTGGPTYLSCWHETLAVDMAVGYTLMTGRTQVAMLHAGVGVMQGYMGIYGARHAGIPLMVMSGDSVTFGDEEGFEPGNQWYTAHNTAGGLHRIVDPVVKWSSQVTSAVTLYDMVIRAGEIAQSSPAGPTYLNISIEAMLQPWTPPAKLRKVARAPRPQPSSSELESLAGLLISAKNPVITASGCGRDPAGYHALVRLAELLAIPVVEGSVAEVSNFPKQHPLHQGFSIQPFLEDADLVLVVRNKVPWYPPKNGPRKATVVVLDDSPFKIHMAYQKYHADLVLEGDASASLQALADIVQRRGVDKVLVGDRLARSAAAHDKLHSGYREAEAKVRDNAGIHPLTLCAALAEVLPADTIYVDETTTHRVPNQKHVRYQGTQSYFRVPSGLGQGLGVSLGIKLAAGERVVATLIGDGAFLYNPIPQSLGFSASEGVPILIIIYNNNGYRNMKNNQLSYYPQGVGARHNIFYGETLGGPAYEKFVEPFGGVGIRVEKPGELRQALAEGLKAVRSGKTAILNVIVE